MTPEQQRIRIAEACGWRWVRESPPANYWALYAPKTGLVVIDEEPGASLPIYLLPDYLNDLNAMHEAEKVMTSDQHGAYITRLTLSVGFDPERAGEMSDEEIETSMFRSHSATASQRAEAFLRALNLWEDGK